jgi:hypothetical protein
VIPRVKIDVAQNVNLGLLVGPGSGTAEYPAWLGIQRDYNSGIYREASWENAFGVIEAEFRALVAISEAAADADQFDNLAYEEFEMEAPLELGVMGLCIALNAAGCVTAYSCRGHPGPRNYPQVLLAADAGRAADLVELCRETGCGIENFEQSGLAIFAPSILEFIDLAAAICRERDHFPTRVF